MGLSTSPALLTNLTHADLYDDLHQISDNTTNDLLLDCDRYPATPTPRDVYQVKFVAYGVVLPVLVSVGVLGDLLNLVVLTRPNMTGVAYVYMRDQVPKQWPRHALSPSPSSRYKAMTEWVSTHRYLGVIVARNNTCQAEVRHLRTKCSIRNRILKALPWKGQGATSSVILSIYKALISSLIDYASPALINISASHAKSLERIQNAALSSVYGAPLWAKTEKLPAEGKR